MTKLNAKELRVSKPTEEDLKKIKRNPIYFILDRIIDTYNIGSLFRLADAVAAEKMFLCGEMEFPPSIKIHRAAVGTEVWVPWEKTEDTLNTVKKLKKEGVHIIAIEQDKGAISYKDITPKFPCAIVAGNETEGLPSAVLKEADTIVELPMYGINKSFNVWGTTAVVTYKVMESVK
jgi:23S rRNA (guanosine2251-2'-O)-methyltransferase